VEKLMPFDKNIKINPQKLVDKCGYELPTNLQNFTQRYLTEVIILLKVFWGDTFFETPGIYIRGAHQICCWQI